MRPMLRLLSLSFAVALVLSGCSSDPPPAATCQPACKATEVCENGVCKPKGTAGKDVGPGDEPDADVEPDEDAGEKAGLDASAKIDNPDNTKLDADCDGLSNAEEFANAYGAEQRKTDPNNADTDGDGILDGVELGRTSSPEERCAAFSGDADSSVRSDPTRLDSDGDGIPDGVEDENHNGRVDLGETSPSHLDTDGDGLGDGLEDKSKNGRVDVGETDAAKPDSDGDGLSDGAEDKDLSGTREATETDPLNADTDGDGCLDGIELKNGSSPLNPGDCNGTGLDSDKDGIPDQTEVLVTHTDPLSADSDGDGVQDGAEDKNKDGKIDAGETDPLSRDSDCDGLNDYLELSVYHTQPLNPDSDADALPDGIEIGIAANPDPTYCPDFHADAEPASRTNPLRKDSDCDGVADGDEDKNRSGKVDAGETDPARRDSDGDGLSDGIERGVTTSPEPTACAGQFVADADPGTKTDPTKADSDGDGLSDGVEDASKNGKLETGETNPASKDSDCDGVGDGEERALRCDPSKADTDGDGLVDGIELGRTANLEPSCPFAGDQDTATKTLPYLADSDGDGLADGAEDKSKNGKLEAGETDPSKADSDSDGLKDGVEAKLGTNPLVADTDGDGLADGVEDVNKDGTRQTNETDATKADTDGDGCSDGAEDKNGNHVTDSGETSPLVPNDCGAVNINTDTDCDGLSDSVEATLGTSPTTADSDGDGVTDGRERGVTLNPDPARCPQAAFLTNAFDSDPGIVTNALSKDTDCDGLADGVEDANKNGKIDAGETSPSNPDSDGDGLTDGVESGVCTNAHPAKCSSVRFDGDCPGPIVTTNPSNPDSDGDGIWDGTEDSNQNGKLDSGELNPKGSDATGPDAQACAQTNLKPIQIIERSGQKADIDFAVSTDFLAGDTSVIRVAGEDRGVMVYDRALQVAGFAFKITPALSGTDVSAQLSTLEARMATAGSPGSKFVQVFTTWDGFAAAGAQYAWTDSLNDTAGKAANDLVAAMLPGASGLLSGAALGTETGAFRLKIELVRRSATTNVVVGALTREASITEARSFRLDDISNGSALAQYGDTVGVQCDRKTVQPRQPVDFIWVVDNSGSMSNEQTAVETAASAMATQLSASTADWRLMVITSNTDVIANSGSSWNAASYGTAAEPKYCPFTRDAAAFQNCMGSVGIAGSGSERFFRPVACLLGAATPYTKSCGRGSDSSWSDSSYGYSVPPAPYPLLTRSATETPNKLRAGAMPAFIFLTDTNEQSDGLFTASSTTPVPANSLNNIPAWVSLFKNIDGLSSPTSVAFVAGLVCPAGGNCSDSGGNYMNTRWPTFFAQMNGVFADLPSDTDGQQTAKIQAAVAMILDKAIGQASPYVLTKPPISATIKVATEALLEGTCNASDIPRSRTHGFDYDGATKAIKFYGNCRPKVGQEGKRIAISYRYWNDRTSDPDGNSPPCGGPCAAPKVCDPVSNTCICPGNCGGTCSNPRACDMNTCGCVCPADCGSNGPCQGNLSCDAASCTCKCQQNQTCGVGFAWNATACACVCNTTCGANQVLDPAICACVCKPDCGGCSGAKGFCDLAGCACGCDPAQTCPPGQKVNPTTCACVCDPTSLFCAPNEQVNATTCSCECKADCGGCQAGYVCDRASCGCVCDTNKTCPAGQKVDPASCSCVCDTDALNCAAPLVADPTTCSCVCAANCGGCPAGWACNSSSCGCECPSTTTCPAGFVLDKATCSCKCDTAALGCAGTYEADPALCGCVCKPECGGCSTGLTCNMSMCSCGSGDPG